jgi:cytochrome c-type biogenesis protein CcmH/NrfG
LAPDELDIRYGYAMALAESNHVLEACAEWERILQSEPDDDLRHATQEMLAMYTHPDSNE